MTIAKTLPLTLEVKVLVSYSPSHMHTLRHWPDKPDGAFPEETSIQEEQGMKPR